MTFPNIDSDANVCERPGHVFDTPEAAAAALQKFADDFGRTADDRPVVELGDFGQLSSEGRFRCHAMIVALSDCDDKVMFSVMFLESTFRRGGIRYAPARQCDDPAPLRDRVDWHWLRAELFKSGFGVIRDRKQTCTLAD